ncbi:MAG: peptidylprolyl isomerase [Betaproteobacteria bacterium]|nr:MAG: peptidylprolyl isomerase [Betaproteobacteria bacterium]
MYDFVHKNKRVVQVILALMVLPFAFVGVDSYVRNMSNEQDVARVGGQPISPVDLENAVRQQQDQMRNILGRNFDPAMFDNPEVKQQVLDGLINQRLLSERATKLSLTAPDAELRRVILEIPAFQENGKFSSERYAEALKGIGQSPLVFEQRLRQDLALQPMQDAISRAAFVGNSQAAAFQRITEEAREVQIAALAPDAYLPKVQVADADIRAEYDKNPDSYRAPEQVKIEYLKLAQSDIAKGVALTADELKAEYEKRKKEFSAPEERRASHILLAVDKDDKGKLKADSLAAAKTKAEALIKQVGTDAGKFADAAKAESKDPGSAPQGGDLGFNARGVMVKPFDDAMFALKAGEVSAPIETEFGIHIIRLTEVKAERVRPFEEVRTQLENDVRQARASKQFAESADKFQNRVYEESDSFAKLAADLKLTPVKTDWLTRTQVQAIGAGNQKFAQTVFTPANLSSKRNIEAVDLGDNALISARVLEHKASAVRPFDEVKAQIQLQLQRKAATELAAKDGAEKTQALLAGSTATGLVFGAPAKVTRQSGAPGINAALLKQVFAADTAKGPAYVGAPSDTGGYSVVRVVKAIEAEAATGEKLKGVAQRLAGQSGADVTNAYLTALKDSIKVEIKKGIGDAKKADAASGTPAPAK